MPALSLQDLFGPIDIYLFDQLLKERISPGMRIVDAGCGSGRNLVYFLREGYEVHAADADARAVDGVRGLAQKLAPALPASNFRAEAVERMSFDDAFADVVVSSAVLHFARDDAHFEAMLQGTWRVLKPGGMFFSPACLHNRDRGPGEAPAGTPISVAGWDGALPGGRGAARGQG